MVIKVGDKLPNVTFKTMSAEGPKSLTTDEAFKGKTVALFAVPGAFTPTCSARHLPSFKENAEAFKAKAEVTPESLAEARLLRDIRNPIVILGRGEMSVSLKVRVHRVSAGAKAKIEKAGGSVELIA